MRGAGILIACGLALVGYVVFYANSYTACRAAGGTPIAWRCLDVREVPL